MSSNKGSDLNLNYCSLEQEDGSTINFKTSDQLKLESLILRISKVCLICSALLFIGQIVSSSISLEKHEIVFRHQVSIKI